MDYKELTFKKESSGRWFINYPEWTGDKSELEMVYGSDTFLDILSEGENSVSLIVSISHFENSEVLNFIRLSTELENGAFYFLETYMNQIFNLEIWLCDVTLFVLGEFPRKIYFLKIN